MDIAAQYAKALSQIEKPSLKNLRAALTYSGREKLLPRVFVEYKKLLLKRERSQQYSKITPAGERTRVLLELYRVLIK